MCQFGASLSEIANCKTIAVYCCVIFLQPEDVSKFMFINICIFLWLFVYCYRIMERVSQVTVSITRPVRDKCVNPDIVMQSMLVLGVKGKAYTESFRLN